MTITRAEIEAVIDYIYWHARTNPEGSAYKVYLKMREELQNDRPRKRRTS